MYEEDLEQIEENQEDEVMREMLEPQEGPERE